MTKVSGLTQLQITEVRSIAEIDSLSVIKFKLTLKLKFQGHPTTISSQMHEKHFFRLLHVALHPKNCCEGDQSTFRPLQMHSKRPYKICICSAILGEPKSFRNCKGFGIIVPKILDAIQRITKVKIILIPLSITFFNPKIQVSFFLRKIAQPGV